MKQIRVVIALLVRGGKVLVQQRGKAQHLGGLWEFPGGKVDMGESDEHALARELNEEIGIQASPTSPVHRFSHTYPDREIEFVVFQIADFSGEPSAKEGNPIKWVSPEQLSSLPMPDANKNIPVTSLIGLS